jgi:predicted neuraminidase
MRSPPPQVAHPGFVAWRVRKCPPVSACTDGSIDAGTIVPAPMPDRMPRSRSVLPLVAMLAGLVLAAQRAPDLRRRDAAFAFEAAAAARVPESRAIGTGTDAAAIDLPNPDPSAHASTMAMLPNGDLLVAWFAGAREGARDVSIRMARLRDGAVADAWQALTVPELQRQVHRVVRKLGNPLLFTAADGTVHLFVVSVSYGGWSGSAVNHLRSSDDGRTWGHARRLVLAPFLNLGTLVRAPALPMRDGSIGLPAYHEFVRKWGVWVLLDPDGRVRSVSTMPAEERSLQPAVAPRDDRRATAVLRRGSGASARVLRSSTEDGGATWSPCEPTDVANPDAGVALLRCADGALLMAANPLERGRHVLALLRSDDDGVTWRHLQDIERGAEGDEFSYPTLIAAPDGTIHLSYTHGRRFVRVRSFAPLGGNG